MKFKKSKKEIHELFVVCSHLVFKIPCFNVFIGAYNEGRRTGILKK